MAEAIGEEPADTVMRQSLILLGLIQPGTTSREMMAGGGGNSYSLLGRPFGPPAPKALNSVPCHRTARARSAHAGFARFFEEGRAA